MKKIINLVIGLMAVASVIYKLVQCPSCDDRILGFTVPGYVYILFWSALAVVLLFAFYKENWVDKQKD